MASFLPSFAPADVQRAAQLVQQSYDPASAHRLSPDDRRRLQSELSELQHLWEAWCLVIPLASYSRPSQDLPRLLTVFLLGITGRSIAFHPNKFILWKPFVTVHLSVVPPFLPVPCRHSWVTPRLSALALCLVPRWPGWIIATATALSGAGASTENIFDFFEIAAEEVNVPTFYQRKGCGKLHSRPLFPSDRIDLIFNLGAHRDQMLQSLRDAIPLVRQAIASSIAPPVDPARLGQLQSALKCFEAWIPNLPTMHASPLLSSPLLSSPLLSSPLLSSTPYYLPYSCSLTPPPTRSSLSLSPPIVSTAHRDRPDETASALCRLLAGLSDHSTAYLAENLHAQLVQVLLSYSVDKEESKRMLGFWYLFQESLWAVEFPPETMREF
ncbi:hypothetical protein EDB85DRAFT_2152377 [Lactarius pseudohatsudake]|nr:hypothetical protein EDB85DRAFT_2152377 [Lactarius pseudohatsudake]